MSDRLCPELIDYWFSPGMREHWFSSTPEIDDEIKSRFLSLWERARTGGLDHWQTTAEGALALAIVLDQLPLNMFRGHAKSFATEGQAIQVSKRAVENGQDRELPQDRLPFLLMPLMHSEMLADQDLSVRLFQAAGLKQNLAFAEHHRQIFRRFGRFPHRNRILGRHSTDEEIAYLESESGFTG